VVTHHKAETHLHPDMATAWQTVGHDVPDAPKSGVGKDPRKDFEDEHWTEEQKAGHRAYIEAIQNGKLKEDSVSSGKTDNLAEKWTEKTDANLKKESLPPVAPVHTAASEGMVKKLADEWTNGGEGKEQLATTKRMTKSPRSSKVSEMAKLFSEKASRVDQEGSAKLSKLERTPGKVSNMANLWTNMERKKSPPPSNDKLSGLKGTKGLVSDRIKAFKEQTPVLEVQEKPVEDKEQIAPSKHESISDQIKNMEDRQKSWQDPDTKDMSSSKRIERLEHRQSITSELGAPQLLENEGETADTSSPQPKLRHLTKTRTRPPKKNRISDA
jgi:hypothetical protein